jgi:hypothetical protein
MREAAKLVSLACYGREDLVSVNEIKVYYSKNCWGDRMNGIEATEPCVYMCDDTTLNSKPFRVI